MRFAQDDSFGFCLPYSIVHFNFHERSELTSIITSSFTSETTVNSKFKITLTSNP